MRDDCSADDMIEFVSGGFAAAATDPENVTPEVFSSLDGQDNKSSFVGLVAEHFVGLFMAYSVKSLIFPSIDIQNACEQIKDYILGRGRPVTGEEFRAALEYDWLFRLLRPILKNYAQQHNMTADELYSRTIAVINENPAYKYISDDDKIKLAKRLTDGLL